MYVFKNEIRLVVLPPRLLVAVAILVYDLELVIRRTVEVARRRVGRVLGERVRGKERDRVAIMTGDRFAKLVAKVSDQKHGLYIYVYLGCQELASMAVDNS